MTISISNNGSTETLPASSPVSAGRASKPPASPAKSTTDTVELSHAAQAALNALKEATEAPAQTAKEASHGDLQARKLLAKQEAAKRKL